jgi:hypothetical protein
MPSPDPHAAPSGIKRRNFLDAILGFGFVSTVLAVFYPIWRYMNPPASGEAATTSVVAGKVTDFKPNSGAVFKFGSKPATWCARRTGVPASRRVHAPRLHGVKSGHVADLVRATTHA